MQFTLKALRVNKGYTQNDVAKILDVCKETILNWETGKTKPKYAARKVLAELYGIEIDNIKF